jgi:hypothetical protein
MRQDIGKFQREVTMENQVCKAKAWEKVSKLDASVRATNIENKSKLEN